MGNLTHDLPIAETFDDMVVYQSGRLHVGSGIATDLTWKPLA
jgi:hypothetical protein